MNPDLLCGCFLWLSFHGLLSPTAVRSPCNWVRFCPCFSLYCLLKTNTTVPLRKDRHGQVRGREWQFNQVQKSSMGAKGIVRFSVLFFLQVVEWETRTPKPDPVMQVRGPGLFSLSCAHPPSFSYLLCLSQGTAFPSYKFRLGTLPETLLPTWLHFLLLLAADLLESWGHFSFGVPCLYGLLSEPCTWYYILRNL